MNVLKVKRVFNYIKITYFIIRSEFEVLSFTTWFHPNQFTLNWHPVNIITAKSDK